MASFASMFLPLTASNPQAQAKVKVGSQPSRQQPSVEQEPQAVKSPEVEVYDEDDGWYDTTSSSSGPSPKKSRSDSHEISLIKVKSITPEEEAQLLPYMPSLFATNLPPCGPRVQVAYENVVDRLRSIWLNQRGRVSVLDICYAVKHTLDSQKARFPTFALKPLHQRPQPYRSEAVFKFELPWIDYFVREAQTQTSERMSESEIIDRKKESPIPPELGFVLTRNDVLKMWDQWNEKRWAKKPGLPESLQNRGAEGHFDGLSGDSKRISESFSAIDLGGRDANMMDGMNGVDEEE